MKTHNLKTWPEFYVRIEDGSKPFEVREAIDRKFAVGDLLRLHEFEPCKICRGSGTASYNGFSNGVKVSFYADCGCLKTKFPRGFLTGRWLERYVSYITDFGQREGWVVIGLSQKNVEVMASSLSHTLTQTCDCEDRDRHPPGTPCEQKVATKGLGYLGETLPAGLMGDPPDAD